MPSVVPCERFHGGRNGILACVVDAAIDVGTWRLGKQVIMNAQQLAAGNPGALAVIQWAVSRQGTLQGARFSVNSGAETPPATPTHRRLCSRVMQRYTDV